MKIDFFEEIASDAIKIRKLYYKKSKILYNQISTYFNRLKIYLKRYLEIKYYQYDLYRKHKALGEYVSNQHFIKNVSDFSYDHSYKEMIKEINQINLVIKTITAKEDFNHKS